MRGPARDPIRLTAAHVDLRRLSDNYRKLRDVVGHQVAVIAVVKADAYGHGSVPVARLLEGAGVRGFAVATVEEGVQLRDAGIRVPVLVMSAAKSSSAWSNRTRKTAAINNIRRS